MNDIDYIEEEHKQDAIAAIREAIFEGTTGTVPWGEGHGEKTNKYIELAGHKLLLLISEYEHTLTEPGPNEKKRRK